MALVSTPATRANHRIRWYARVQPDGYVPDGWLPRNSQMADASFGWDVKCSCGQQTGTGGAIAARIREAVYWHREIGQDL